MDDYERRSEYCGPMTPKRARQHRPRALKRGSGAKWASRRWAGAEEREAGSKAFEILLTVWASCKKLSAKDFCTVCGYLAKCQVPGGRWSTFGLPPDLDSGRYKKEMDKHLPGGGPFYVARVPAFLSKTSHQNSKSVLFRQVFDSIVSEVEASPDLQEALRHGELYDYDSIMSTPAYQEHPRVRECVRDQGTYPLPLALYVDGVRYTAATAGRNDQSTSSLPQPQPQPTQNQIADITRSPVDHGQPMGRAGRRGAIPWLGAL